MTDPVALRVMQRWAAKPMPDEKMKELLLKIRKGATSSVNWSQLGQVLALLDPGWKMEKFVGLVKLYGFKENSDAPEFITSDNRQEIDSKYDHYKSFAVTSLPSKPKHGQVYVLDLTEIVERKSPYNKSQSEWHFEFKPWMGHDAVKTTAPNGQSFDELPSRHGLSGNAFLGYSPNRKLQTWDTIKWLNTKTDWLDQINKKLGLEEFQPAVPRTREHTGSCPICFQNIKLKEGGRLPTMVLHGYRRPGTGTIHGNCYGMGYPPFELSVEGTKSYLVEVITPARERAEAKVKLFKDGKVKIIHIHDHSTVEEGDPNWDRVLKGAKEEADRMLTRAEDEEDAFKRLVQHWKERDLPKEGEPHINWFYKGQKG